MPELTLRLPLGQAFTPTKHLPRQTDKWNHQMTTGGMSESSSLKGAFETRFYSLAEHHVPDNTTTLKHKGTPLTLLGRGKAGTLPLLSQLAAQVHHTACRNEAIPEKERKPQHRLQI